MTTNTDVAMPELLKPYAKHAIWNPNPGGGWDQYHDAGDPIPDKWDDGAPDLVVDLYTADQVRTAIQQAAGAVPEELVPCPTCDQTGLVTEMGDKYFRRAHCPSCHGRGKVAPPKQQPVHLGGGEGGGVPQWQPIETAPKASKAILVYCADRKNTYTATWARDKEFPWSGKWKHFPGGFIDEAPTHWMPLPDDPAPRPESTTGQINKPAGQGMEGGS